jgi:polar amino acid transport system substrate-binding protein
VAATLTRPGARFADVTLYVSPSSVRGADRHEVLGWVGLVDMPRGEEAAVARTSVGPRWADSGPCRYGEARAGYSAGMPRLLLSLLSSTFACLLAAGCGLTIPADPEKTLERVTGSTMRVGVSPHSPWTDISGAGEPSGTEVDLVREFAGTLPAQVEWVVGGEQSLIAALERGELQLVIGGLTSETPWTEKAAITKPYAEMKDPRASARSS